MLTHAFLKVMDSPLTFFNVTFSPLEHVCNHSTLFVVIVVGLYHCWASAKKFALLGTVAKEYIFC